MRAKRATLEEKMTPEERELFEKFRQQIGKEFRIEECVPQYSERVERMSYLSGYDENVHWPGIKRWAIVNEDFNGLWFDEEYAKRSRWRGIIAPPLYLLAIDDGMAPSSWLVYEVYDMSSGTINTKKYPNFVGGLQANSDWEFLEPLYLGDKITTIGKCTDIYWKQGKQYRLLFAFGETTYTNQRGQLVACCRAGAVYRFK